MRSRQESDLDRKIRNLAFYPLNYGSDCPNNIKKHLTPHPLLEQGREIIGTLDVRHLPLLK